MAKSINRIDRIAEKVAIAMVKIDRLDPISPSYIAKQSYEIAHALVKESGNHLDDSELSKIENAIPIGRTNAKPFDDLGLNMDYLKFIRAAEWIRDFIQIPGRGEPSRFYLDRSGE